MPELPVKNIFFGNAKVKCQRIGRLQDVTGFAMKDVDIHSEDSLLTLDGCSVVVNPLSPIHYSQKLERPHIIKNPRNGKYVLWAKSQATDGYFAIFQADNFMGPYTFIRNLQPEGYGVGDFDMYVDEQTGKGYVWFERPHWELICAELTDDFLDVTDVYSNHFVGKRPPYTREAPAHFFARSLKVRSRRSSTADTS